MDKKEAIQEVKRMKSASPTEYFANLPAPTPAVKSAELPVKLDESHAALNETRALLAESHLNGAKMSVAIEVAKDTRRIEDLLKAGKLTVPVAEKLITLCENKRADQIVRLSEGEVGAAADSGQDIDAILDMMGELPATVATEAAPAAEAAIPAGDPTGAAAPEMGYEEQLDALAKEIAAQKGISYTEALMMAQAQLGADPAMAGAAGGM